MKYDDILNVLAPCGINCIKCVAFDEGDIKHHSKILLEKLGDFEPYAEKFSRFFPVYKKYSEFREMAEFFSKADCKGCRSGQCIFSSCYVMNCIKDKKIDYCFQCEDFPCDNVNFDEAIKNRWIALNTKMKDIGVEAVYEEVKDNPRY